MSESTKSSTETYFIFDFDGVLGDTLEASVWVNMKINGLPAEAYEESLESIKRYLDFPKHNKQKNLTLEEKATLLQHYVRWGQLLVEQGFSLFEGFIRELRKLNNKVKMAVVTSGSSLYVLPTLQQSGVLFDEILTIEDGLSKEEKVERICANWGVSIQDVYYFTDTTGDVHELEKSLDREKIYGVSWGWHGAEHLTTALPFSRILTSFSDIHLVSPKCKVIRIGGGDTYSDYDHYLTDLHSSELRLETSSPSPQWKYWLLDRLNATSGFSAYNITMPNTANAQYGEWKIQFEKISRFLNPQDILVGHSLGGIFLLKYLSENPIKLAQVHIVAAPYNGCFGFNFQPELLIHFAPQLHFYHSTDDFVVPFTDFQQFQQLLPQAQFHEFHDRNHFLTDQIPELLDVIVPQH